jgi:hypothetical protein
MREPDAWFEHIPVSSRSYSENLGEYWDWHKAQLNEAIKEVMIRHPLAMAIIPAEGFYIMAVRKRQKYNNGQPEDLVVVVCIFEDDDQITFRGVSGPIVTRGGVVRQGLSELGSSHNPFVELFENLVRNAPNEWPEFLKRRRRLHSTPIPRWLIEIRRQERRARARQRRLLKSQGTR